MDKTLTNQPLVSVIMPVFNGEKFIDEAILSILNQSYQNLELIIVNDGSVDKSEDIILKYKKKDKRIKYYKNRQNMGISKSLNKAVALSKGKYVARMDCDDINLPNRIVTEVEVLERNNDIKICGTWGKAVDETGRFLFLMKSPTGLVLKYNFWKNSPFISSSTMIRRVVFDEYLFRSEFDFVEDYDICTRILKKYKGFNLKQELVCYRINSFGVSKKNSTKQIERAMQSLCKNLGIKINSIDDYLSLVCQSYKISVCERANLLSGISKKNDYPIWFLIVDSLYYFFRKLRKNMFVFN